MDQDFEGRAGEVFAGRHQGFAQEQETRGIVCDGQRVAVPPVAELEFAFDARIALRRGARVVEDSRRGDAR